MLRVDDHRDAMRVEIVPDAARDFCGEALLHLQPPRIAIEHARELGNADDAVARQIGDRCLAGDRRHMMFAMRLERNRSEEHTSELQSLMRISYAVFCLKTKLIELLLTHDSNRCV